MGVQKNPYPLRVDDDIMEKTKVIAKVNGRSVNKEIEVLLRQLVANYEKENGVIEISLPR